MDPRVQKIVYLKEALTLLPDAQFFELMHMYLGEIKTPYNKQRLVEQLTAFFRNEENRKIILKLLTSEDVKILCAIKFINEANPSKLEIFFGEEIPFSKLYEKLINLTERFLIFSYTDKISGKKIIDVNPLFQNELENFLTLTNLISGQPKEYLQETKAFVSSDFIAAFISYVNLHNDLCKASGEFKKKTVNELKEIFGEDEKQNTIEKLQLIFNALYQLNIIAEKEENYFVDFKRLSLFAELDERSQLIYFCAAANGKFSKSTIQKNAQLFYKTLEVLSTVSFNAYSSAEICQIAYLLKEKNGGDENFSGRRFSQILSGGSADDGSYGSSTIILNMLENAELFGMVSVQSDEDEKKYFSLSENYINLLQKNYGEKKVLSLDSVFSISVMPGLSLEEYVELIQFLSIVRFDTVSTYEIIKKSVMNAFDNGYSLSSILETLEKYSSYKIPQAFQANIEEWQQSYSSAAFYKGYVLKVAAENSDVVENNPVIKNCIYEVLAPGIFLLNCTCDEEAKNVIEKSGLDFIGGIKSPKAKIRIEGYRQLSSFDEKLKLSEGEVFENDENEAREFLNSLEEELKNIEMTTEQKTGLQERIAKRIILNKSQLIPESVRFEKNEVFGMDFNDKVILIDSSISSGSMMEIEFRGDSKVILVTPINFNRKTGFLRVSMEPDHYEDEVQVASVIRMKKIKRSLLI